MRRLVLLCVVILATCTMQGTTNRALNGTDSGNPSLPAGAAAGMMLQAVDDANMRNRPDPNGLVIRVIPAGAVVKLLEATTQAGYAHIDHDGLVGFAYAGSFTIYDPPAPPPTENADAPVQDPPDVAWAPGSFAPGSPVPAPSPEPTPAPTPTPTPEPAPTPTPDPGPGPQQQTSPRDDAIARAQSGLGYSYWWGGAAWIPNSADSTNPGECFVNKDGSLGHSGDYGADCSGYVGKVWQVPDDNTDLSTNAHPYSTYAFNFTYAHWSDVDRSSLQPADALVYNDGSHGHIFLYDSGDGWGSVMAYESSDCGIPIGYHLRNAASAYKGISRDGY